MPIFEFDEMESARVVDGVQLYNYWGYNTVSFFAPNTSYAFHQEHNHEGDELKRLIRELKENGIEVILDVVFNHTAEEMKTVHVFALRGLITIFIICLHRMDIITISAAVAMS